MLICFVVTEICQFTKVLHEYLHSQRISMFVVNEMAEKSPLVMLLEDEKKAENCTQFCSDVVNYLTVYIGSKQLKTLLYPGM